MLLLIQSEPNSVLAVHDVRAALECMSAETAATMAGPDNLREIEESLERMEKDLDDPNANVAADLEFHLALARATHNGILLSVLQPLIEPIHECMLRGTHVPTAALRAVAYHRSIADAVRKRAPREARASMHQHMHTTREELMSLIDEGLEPSMWLDRRSRAPAPLKAVPAQ